MNGRKFWGPPTWGAIHMIPWLCEKQNINYYIEFIILLPYLLPCDACRENLKKKMQVLNPRAAIKNRESAFLYSYTIHDLANKAISKENPNEPEKISPEFTEIREYYKNSSKNPKIWGPPMWKMIHSFAATMKYHDALKFKRFLEILPNLIPKQFTQNVSNFYRKLNLGVYLRTNHDIFLYTYILHKHINEITNHKNEDYNTVKIFYFNALGQECRECQI